MDEKASKFGLRVSCTKTKITNFRSGPTPSPIIVDGNTIDPVEEFTYLGSIQSSKSSSRPECGALDSRPMQWKDSTVSGVSASLVSPRSSAYTSRACYPYYSMALRPGPSYKPTGINWILSIYGAKDASCISAGTTSYLTMKFCVVPACSTSRTSSVSEDWVSSVTSPDFEVMCQQTRSDKSAPRRGWRAAFTGVETCLWSPIDHLDLPDLPRHGCNSDWGPVVIGGPTVLVNDRNCGRLRLNASRHDDDDDDRQHVEVRNTAKLFWGFQICVFWRRALTIAEISRVHQSTSQSLLPYMTWHCVSVVVAVTLLFRSR